jgi:hypothetical protein
LATEKSIKFVTPFVPVCSTVKPALRTTSEQQPPVNNDQNETPTTNLNLTFYQAPLSNGNSFLVPKVLVVHRFAVTSVSGEQRLVTTDQWGRKIGINLLILT